MHDIYRGDVKDFFEYTRSQIGSKLAHDNRIDHVTELKKYSELKDEGIITEEEFEAKKKQLLKL